MRSRAMPLSFLRAARQERIQLAVGSDAVKSSRGSLLRYFVRGASRGPQFLWNQF